MSDAAWFLLGVFVAPAALFLWAVVFDGVEGLIDHWRKRRARGLRGE